MHFFHAIFLCFWGASFLVTPYFIKLAREIWMVFSCSNSLRVKNNGNLRTKLSSNAGVDCPSFHSVPPHSVNCLRLLL